MELTDIKWNEITFPSGWHLREEFKDDLGNKYSRGKVTQLYDGTVVDPPVAVSQLKLTSPKETTIEDNFAKLARQVDRLQAELDLARKTGGDKLSIKDLADQIAKSNREMDGKPVYETHIEPEDYLEVPVMFSSYGTGYSIRDDKRNGANVKIPGGTPAIFRYKAGWVMKNGPRQSYISYCAHIEYSKKRVQWLREHSLYNKEFFENIKHDRRFRDWGLYA